MQGKIDKEKLVIGFIGNDFIIKYEHKKNNNRPDERNKKRLPQFL